MTDDEYRAWPRPRVSAVSTRSRHRDCPPKTQFDGVSVCIEGGWRLEGSEDVDSFDHCSLIREDCAEW